MSAIAKFESILDIILAERQGVIATVGKWAALSRLDQDEKRRIRFISRLIDNAEPSREDTLKAAYLLRTMGFINDAIRVLKKFREYEEAAELLFVVGRGKEGARLLEGRRRFDRAAIYYGKSGLKADAARCFETAGIYHKAGTVYEAIRMFGEAGRCYERAHIPSAAALCYANAGTYSPCMDMFEDWEDSSPEDFKAMPIGYAEALVLGMARGRLIPKFVSLLEDRGILADLIRELLRAGQDVKAMELYAEFREQVVDDLCRWAENDLKDGFRALKLFKCAGDKKAEKLADNHFAIADTTRLKTTQPVTKPNLSPELLDKCEEQERLKDTAFAKTDFFREIDSASRDMIWECGDVSSHARSHILVEFGEIPRGSLTVLDGRITLYRRHDRKVERIGTFHRGQTIGESWLLYRLPSDVRIIATSPCTVHVANREKVNESDDGLSETIAARLARHLIERVKPGAFDEQPFIPEPPSCA